MKEIKKDVKLIAFCGLYCGACGQYINESCPGCAENVKAGWCKIRSCCMEKNYKTCADCVDFTDVADCGKFNNIISKIFALIFRSNRKACIQQIRDKGISGHVEIMTRLGKQTLPR